MSTSAESPSIERVHEAARRWIAADPDPVTRDELTALLEASDDEELLDRVGVSLTFGTAGLRAAVGAGSNRMNRAVVIRTTRGLVDHLLDTDPDAAARGIVVGFDARADSSRFAEDVVAVCAAAGVRVRRFTRPQPTPLVAFAQKHFSAAAGVVITASHNPPADNGYKVYTAGASQIIPPEDLQIAAAIERVGPANQVARVEPATSELVADIGEDVARAYLDALADARPAVQGPRPRVVYTPLHGVGAELVRRAFEEAGYDDLHIVAEQAEPDGSFPTVSFPNPEEPGALDAALALARDVAADVVLANDPDADRLAVAAPDEEGRYRPLTGNQIGVLLADHLLSGTSAARPLVVSSIVSTPMIHAVAEHHGARSEVTLTGFKWVVAAARDLAVSDDRDFVYGFEEALGSCVGDVVRDKDGIGAAVVFADMVRALSGRGGSVWDRWWELCREHGVWVSRQRSVTREGTHGAAEIAEAMHALDDTIPTELAGHAVLGATDLRRDADRRPPWLGVHDLVMLELEDGRAMIRPSGTEPKCKAYVDLRAAVGESDDVDAVSDRLATEADAVADALLAAVGLR